MKNLYRIVFIALFALSLGINCAYVTGCCSCSLGFSDDNGDRPGPSKASTENDTRLRHIANTLGVFVPSDADAEYVEDLLVKAVSYQERINATEIPSNVWEMVLSTAEDMEVKEPFEQLKRVSEKTKRGKLVILRPSAP